jgi:predicted permease
MITGLAARARSLWRGVRRRAVLEAEMHEELRLHMELRAEDLVRSGISPAEAARRARLEFGSTERYKDEMRQARGLRPFDQLGVSWLDFKLGFRMLARYPGLTFVGGLAFAFAIAAGATSFEFLTQMLHPTLPLRDGDRIVGIRTWDMQASRTERRTLHDFVAWRDEIQSIEELGAFRELQRNLITGEARGEPVEVAEISASAFRLTGVAPLLGRALVEADERAGAPPVVAIGADVWRTRFASDSAVVGRTIQLGDARYTVVGIMPAGFAFPIAHSFWIPLRLNPLDYEPGKGPEIRVFGRLAPGATRAMAQAELTTLARRAAADFPDTHARRRLEVMPYPRSIANSGVPVPGIISIYVFLGMLLVLVFGNVALLLFARAVTREEEIVVRTALGAGRGRIITQLFAEALVLGGVAAVVGLAAAALLLRWTMAVFVAAQGGRTPPFWFSDQLAPATVLYAVVLTGVGAAIAGVLPALKVTRGVGTRPRQAVAGGGGLRFGGVWTAVIVAQVAVTVAFPVTAFFTRRDAVQVRSLDVGVAAPEYLALRLDMDRARHVGVPGDTSRAAYIARIRTVYAELGRRISAEPGVDGVTFATLLPSMDHPQRRIEVDGGPAVSDTAAALRVSSASVAPNYFEVLGAPILSGRGFHSGDLASDGAAVVVNQSLVRQILGGRNPIGRRVRYIEADDPDTPAATRFQPSPWYEIVGVVRDLGMTDGYDPRESGAGLYHPAAPGAAFPVRMAVHVRGDPVSFAPRLRAIALAVDPALRLHDLLPLDGIRERSLREIAFWFRLLAGVSAIALLLSLAGIYSVMAFTVARRTREIGIRVALGADRWRVVTAVFARPLTQVGFGILAGGVLVATLVLTIVGALSAREIALIIAYALLMMGVCLLACVIPTRRALRIEPSEALRADG